MSDRYSKSRETTGSMPFGLGGPFIRESRIRDNETGKEGRAIGWVADNSWSDLDEEAWDDLHDDE